MDQFVSELPPLTVSSPGDCPQAFIARASRVSLRAFSLVELLVVVSVIAVLATVVIPMIGRTLLTTTAQTASRNLNYLNGAVQTYNQAAGELNTSTNEAAIVSLLQTRNAAYLGSPFLPTNLKSVSTSDSNTYRAKWTGRMFEQVSPGTAGTGIDLLKLM